MDSRLSLRPLFTLLLALAFGLTVTGRASALVNTTTTVSSSSAGNTSVFGTPVTFTVTVQGLPGSSPSGPVTLTDPANGTVGATNLPTPSVGQIAAGTNSVSFTTAALTAGSHTLTATYGGDGNYNGSAGTVGQTVTQAGTSLSTPTTSLSPSNPGDAVTFTTVLSLTSGGGTPGGTIRFQDAGTTFASAPVSGAGTYSVSYSGLSSGTHTITAFYSGDANYTTATSASLSQIVKNATTTALTSSLPSSTFGQTVTLTATVSGGASPVGTVQFQDTFSGATAVLGSVILSGGQAQIAVSTLGAGTHSIVAVFSGDGFNGGSASAPLTQTVAQATPTLSLATTPSPATIVTGQQITLSASLAPQFAGSGPPSGSVLFTVTPQGGSARAVGTGALSGGATSITTSSLVASESQYTVTATYVPGSDPNFASVSQSTAVTVNRAGTSISTPTSSSSTASFGQPVTITTQVAVVGPGGGTPGGTVTFTDNYTNGSGSTTVLTYGPFPVAGGQAQFTVTATQLAPGTHAITAAYSGDGNYSPSGPSGTLTQTVTAAGVSVVVTSNQSTSVYGQPITFTATIGSGAGSPSGTVQFQVDGAPVGTPIPLAGNQASLTIPSGPITAIAAGPHTVTAVYSGDANFAANSGSIPQNVAKAATTATATANPGGSSTFGQSVTFTAQVSVVSPGAGTPTQSVTFQDTFNGSTTTIGTGNVNGSGQAQFTTTSLGVGAHSITVVYGGDANFSASPASAPLPLTVNQAANTVLIVSTNNADAGAVLNTSVYGQSLTFTASVRGGTAGTPTGVVDFFDGSTAPPTRIGIATLDSAGAARTVLSAPLNAGVHPITAHYEGDASNAPADSPVLIETVGPAATVTSVTTNNATPIPGDPVTFTATVTDTSLGSSVTPSAPGSVQFQLDGTNVKHDGTPGDQAITLSASGQASFTAAALAPGTHQVKATYGSDGNFTPSIGAFTQPASVPTVTQLTPNSELENDPAFQITINGNGFIPGAIVVFNGNPVAADSVNSTGTVITAMISGALLAQPGTVQVSVKNPGQPVTSNALPFQIKSPNGPTLFSANPTGVLSGLIPSNGTLTVTLTGSNFTPDAVVGYTPPGGSTIILPRPGNVRFIDSTHLQVAIPGSFLQPNGTASITVRNNDPGGGGQLVSNPVTFTIGENPAPFITGFNPAGVAVNGNPGTDSFTLNVLGGNFLPGAVVTFTDPQGVPTLFGADSAVVSATGDQVSVTIQNSRVAQAGKYNVQVTNVKSINGTTSPPSFSYDGAAPSSPQAFTVSNRQPFVDGTRFSPGFAVAGATTAPNVFALTITGSNFDPGATATSQHSTVVFNNTTLSQNSVRVINSTTLIANIDASLVSTAGLVSLAVSNIGSDGVTQIPSNAVKFPVNPVYARGTYPAHGIAMFSVPYDYSGSNPFDIIKAVTFGPGLSAGAQYFGLGTTPGSNVLSDLQDLLALSANATPKIAQWSPQGLAYAFASAPNPSSPNNLDLQLQLGRAYWGVNFPDRNGNAPGAFGVIKVGASATVNPYPVPLVRGWNMVGDPYPTAVSIFGVTVQRAGRVYSFSEAVANGFISPIFWSYEGGPSYAAHYPGKIDPNSPIKDTLDPFAGYWLLCNTDCQLLVPRP